MLNWAPEPPGGGDGGAPKALDGALKGLDGAPKGLDGALKGLDGAPKGLVGDDGRAPNVNDEADDPPAVDGGRAPNENVGAG